MVVAVIVVVLWGYDICERSGYCYGICVVSSIHVSGLYGDRMEAERVKKGDEEAGRDRGRGGAIYGVLGEFEGGFG